MGDNKGVGVHKSYQEEAHKGCDLLFRVTIKGRTMLTDDIPLHMSIKIFKSPSEYDMDELTAYVNEHNIQKPDPKDLEFKPIIFTSERTGDQFYMLEVNGTSPEFKKLYDEYDDVGNVYKKFFTHITIDKEIYDDVKENGLKAEDIEFSNLIMEHGASNTVKDFGKSEELDKSNYGPKQMALYSQAENARRKAGRTGEVAPVGPNKAVQHAGPTRSEQAQAAAKIAAQKSRKNPVKHFSPNQIKHLKRKAAKNGGSLGVPIKSKLAASEEESLNKAGGIKRIAAAVGVAASMMGAPSKVGETKAPPTVPQVQQSQYNSQRMLHTISAVETENGRNTAHKPVTGAVHGGESAFGRYGLMPTTIRETIGMNRELKQKHGKAMNLRGDDMRRYMEDNPGLEDTVANKHLQRLEHHFGQNPEKIGYAWLEGIRGTYRADKEKKNIKDHWHVKKITSAYGKEK